MVIAHHGTIGNLWSYWNDFLLALEKAPAQFTKGAYLFDEYVRQYMDKTYPIPSPQIYYTITHTGHSLGAVLAELCVASSVRFMQSNGPAMGTTFESPGSKPIIANMESKGELPAGALSCVQNFVCAALADVDAINTCNEQIGSLSYLGDASRIGYDCKIDSTDAGILPPSELLYFSNYTLHDQHKMKRMYEYWKDSQEYEVLKKWAAEDIPWPAGFESGYHCYLNYDLRQDYWDGYIQYVWDNHPEIHQEYNNDPSQWSQFFQSNLILNKPKADNFSEQKTETKKILSSRADRFTLFGSENDTCGQFVLVDEDEERAEKEKEKIRRPGVFIVQ